MKQKLKILFIGRFPPPIHGAAIMNEFYFNLLKIKSKFEVKRIIINKKGNFNNIGKFGLKNLFWIIFSYLKTIRELFFFKPNLIYFELAPNGIAFYRDSFYVILCKIFKKKILFHLHSRNLERNAYSRFIFKNTKIIILSKLLIKEVDDLFKKENIYFLPNGIPDQINDLEFSKIIKKRKQNKIPNLIFLSNMIEDKGTIDFLKICGYLKDKGLKFRAIFAGSWPDQKTEERWFLIRNSMGLQKFCIYAGEKFDKEKNKLLEQGHILVLPTKYKNESFPLVILEAFMFGIPVLAYENGAIKEIVSKRYLGKVFEINRWDKIAKELLNNIKKFSEIKNMKKIRKHFKKNYTIKIAEKELIKIFEKEIKIK